MNRQVYADLRALNVPAEVAIWYARHRDGRGRLMTPRTLREYTQYPHACRRYGTR